MTVSYRLEHGTVYKCDICQREGRWDDNWWWYGSNIDQETCPEDLPMACGEPCRKVLERRVKTGVFRLPVVKPPRGYRHARVIAERVGY